MFGSVGRDLLDEVRERVRPQKGRIEAAVYSKGAVTLVVVAPEVEKLMDETGLGIESPLIV